MFVVLVGAGAYWFSTQNSDTTNTSVSPSSVQPSTSSATTPELLSIAQKILTIDDVDLPYEIHASIPQVRGGAGDDRVQKINQQLEAKVNVILDDFKKRATELATKDTPRSELTLDYDLTAFNAKLMSLNLTIYENIGGAAHPNTFLQGFTYDFIHDRQITSLADVFRNDTDYLSRLSTLSRDDLKSQFAKMGIEPDAAFDEGTSPKAENFQNFILTVRGVRIIFNPYQIAPYAAGGFRVDIATQTIKDILPTDSVLFLFN